MECVLNERRIKYDAGEIYIYKENKTRPSYWLLLTGTIGNNGYKKTKLKKKEFLFHRIIYKIHNPDWDITDVSKTNQIDHIDRNRINNNINNLRVVDSKENQWNRDVKGYFWTHKRGWRVQLMVNGKAIYGGTFKTEEEAIKKRDELKKEYHNII